MEFNHEKRFMYRGHTRPIRSSIHNIMCSQDEIIDYLNESDDFDPQTFDNLFDNICNAKETYLSETTKGL